MSSFKRPINPQVRAVALGTEIADPVIGLLITLVILKITWDSWRVKTSTAPDGHTERHRH